MKIHTYILSCVLIFLGGLFMVSWQTFASSVNGSSSSKVTRYISVAKSTVEKYVSRLESAGYTDEQIVASLESRKAMYLSKKSSKIYKWTYKYQVDAILYALEEAIDEYQGDSSVYDDLEPDPYIPPVSCTQEVRMCADGSYVSRSGPRCEFSTCPTVSPPKENYITSVTNSVISNTVYSRFNTSSNSYYKEYDVYVFTPTLNGRNGAQTYAGNFIYGPEKLIYNTYNSYTITTQFQPTYDKQKVATIRSQLLTSNYSHKKSVSLYSQSQEAFTVRSSDEFDQNAVKTFDNTYYYETYYLYVAKDNSEAFTLRYAQTAKKQFVSDMQINTVGLIGMSYNATLTYKNALYSNYTLMYYTPSLYSSPTIVNSQLGINTPSTVLNYTQNVSWGLNNTVYYSINGYKVDPANIANVKSYFVGSMSVNPTTPSNLNILYYWLRSEYNFNQTRMTDGTARTYLLLVSPDNRQAYITEFTQYVPYTY